MAGTLFGVPLSQQIGPDGRAAAGALIYVYDANTSTPVNTYSDFALSDLNTWPMEADSTGRVPQFWVDDGSYRLRITTSAGVELIDEATITAIGASDGGSGGGGTTVASENSLQTGDVMWQPVSGTKSGWIRLNGRTVGNGSSAGTERANGDTEAVFAYLWNNFSDSFCAVGGGRGASATADFNANKAIAALDMRSKSPFGLDNMGNTNLGASGGSTVAATAIGATTYEITQAHLPNVNFSSTGLTVTGTVVLTYSTRSDVSVSGAQQAVTSITTSGGNTTREIDLDDGDVVGTIPSGGSGSDVFVVHPVRAGTYYMKC